MMQIIKRFIFEISVGLTIAILVFWLGLNGSSASPEGPRIPINDINKSGPEIVTSGPVTPPPKLPEEIDKEIKIQLKINDLGNLRRQKVEEIIGLQPTGCESRGGYETCDYQKSGITVDDKTYTVYFSLIYTSNAEFYGHGNYVKVLE